LGGEGRGAEKAVTPAYSESRKGGKKGNFPFSAGRSEENFELLFEGQSEGRRRVGREKKKLCPSPAQKGSVKVPGEKGKGI